MINHAFLVQSRDTIRRWMLGIAYVSELARDVRLIREKGSIRTPSLRLCVQHIVLRETL
jgi:hypothetical protein